MGFPFKRIGSSPTNAGKDGGVFDKFDNYYSNQEGALLQSPVVVPVSGHQATGGTVGDYYDPTGDYYRVHLFSEPGTFTISQLGSSEPAHVEYLVVGGGGGGGDGDGSGGGGAGGVKSTDPGIPAPVRGSALPVAATSYAVVVGEGGKSKAYVNQSNSLRPNLGQGGTSSLAYNGGTISCGGGGGGGMGYNNGTGGTSAPGNLVHNGHAGVADNGSGGGGSSSSGTSAPTGGWVGGEGNANGNDGGSGYHLSGIFIAGGGGGGAGGVGADAAVSSPTLGIAGVGGNGIALTFFGPTNPVTIAGGGGGGGRGGPNSQQGANGGPGGGGAGSSESGGGNKTGGTGLNNGQPSLQGGNAGSAGHLTGSGGGGGSTDGFRAGNGGPGMVAIKYVIGPGNPVGPATLDAKATGGQVTIYSDHAIHVFKSAGTFTNTSGSDITGIEYVAVGGGGAGGSGGGTIVGGGGGAGGVVSNIPGLMPTTTALPGPNTLGTGTPNALTITIGTGGAAMVSSTPTNDTGGLPGQNTTIASPTATLVTANGGGGGGGNDPSQVINVNGANTNDRTQPGGSGGGGAESDHAGGEGTAGQGNDGGTGSESDNCAGGGGGASVAGFPGSHPTPGVEGCGGNGVQLPSGFRSPTLAPSNGAGLGAPGPGGNFWVAGGGSSLYGIWSGNDFSPRVAGYGGGGKGIFGGSPGAPWSGHPQYPTLGPQMDNKPGEPGMMGSGGGGGAGPDGSPPTGTDVGGGHGGSGLVVIRYPTS